MSTSQTQEQAPPAEVAIRAAPPSPKRLSRKVLLAGTLGAGAVIAFALVSGLSERPERAGAAEVNAVAAAGGPPESIQQAAADYDVNDLPGAVRLLEEADLTFAGADDGELQPPADPLWSASGGGARGDGGPRRLTRKR